jgi:hypothetical protein
MPPEDVPSSGEAISNTMSASYPSLGDGWIAATTILSIGLVMTFAGRLAVLCPFLVQGCPDVSRSAYRRPRVDAR